MICWRLNTELRAKHLRKKPRLFRRWCEALRMWNRDPIASYQQNVPTRLYDADVSHVEDEERYDMEILQNGEDDLFRLHVRMENFSPI